MGDHGRGDRVRYDDRDGCQQNAWVGVANGKNGSLETSGEEIAMRPNGIHRYGGREKEEEEEEEKVVTVSGQNVPLAMETFAQANLHPWLKRNLQRETFNTPTLVQKHAIPVAMEGHDMVVYAPVGTGKTASCLFPVIDMLLKSAIAEQRQHLQMLQQRDFIGTYLHYEDAQGTSNRDRTAPRPLALILVPTRDLCLQLYEETKKFIRDTPVRIVALYGGSATYEQYEKLQRGCHIVVATPGRLAHLIERKTIVLRDLRYVVFGEAVRLLDIKFEEPIHRIMNEHMMPPPGQRQTLMYSSTFPEEIHSFAQSLLHQPVSITVKREESALESITQRVVYVGEEYKQHYLLQLLKETEAHGIEHSLVFVRKKTTARNLESSLLRRDIKAAAIHGDKLQAAKESALKSFKQGQLKVLVTTQNAAIGLNVGEPQHVINFDLPESIERYMNQIECVGHGEGSNRLATSFFNEETNSFLAGDLANLLKKSNAEIPGFLLQRKDSSPYTTEGQTFVMKRRQSGSLKYNRPIRKTGTELSKGTTPMRSLSELNFEEG